MSFMYSMSIPTYVASYPWVDTLVPLNTIAVLLCAPTSFTAVGPTMVGGTVPSTYNTPISFGSTFFKYYRGSIGFKFKFVKTEFHSGRLVFMFVPGYGSGAPTPTDNTMPYLHRAIVDIRYTTEFEFICPWASTVPYLDVTVPYGTLYVSVINELRHPDTVASNINMLTEVFAANDFEFAVPSQPNKGFFLYGGTQTQSGGRRRIAPSKIVTQAGEVSTGQTVSESQPNEEPGTIGTSTIVPDGYSAAKYCIGEKMQSYKQLLSRAVPLYDSFQSSQYVQFSFYPFANAIYNYNNSSDTLSIPTISSNCQDYYSVIISCFGFFRGGVRIRAYPLSGAIGTSQAARLTYLVDSKITQTYPLGLAQFSTTLTDAPGFISFPPVVTVVSSQYPVPEIRVPYYNNFALSNVVSNFNGNAYVGTPPLGRVYMRTAANTADMGVITRQCDDDFTMHFWTGPPATYQKSATVLPSILANW
jgi:hypothetical protein